MIDAIKEVVEDISRPMLGRIPRSRVRLFAEQLANSLLLDNSTSLEMLIVAAARAVYLDPNEIVKDMPLRDEERKEFLTYSNGRFCICDSPLPNWSARDFCATRFGSTKLRTFPNPITGKEEATLHHPYTRPSQYAYNQLALYLIAMADTADDYQ